MRAAAIIKAIRQAIFPCSRPIIDYPRKKDTSKTPNPPRWLKPSKHVAYLAIVGSSLYSAWNSVTGNWEINNLAALARVTTSASGTTIPVPPTLFPEYTLDAFIAGHVNPQEIKDSMIEANIDPKAIDLNEDHIIANTSEEAEKLAQELMISTNSKLPEKILEASKYSELIVPSRSVPIQQGEELNCFLMDEIEGLPEQFKKGMIRVVEFNEDTMDMKYEVIINGKTHTISRLGEGGVNKWISSSFTSSSSGDYLLVPLITLASEKAFNEQKLFGFISLPQKYQVWRLPPGYARLLTGKPHSAILTKNLSLAQLRKILSNSDKTVITLAKFPTREDIAGTYKEPGLFQRLDKYYDRGHSVPKENNFETKFQGLVHRVESKKQQCLASAHEQPSLNNPIDATCTPRDKTTDTLVVIEEKTKATKKEEEKPRVKPIGTFAQLTTNHVYRVVNGKNEKCNLIEDNSRRFFMSDEEILKNFGGNVDVIVVDNEYLEHFPIGPLASGLIGLVVVNLGARGLKRKLSS